MMNSTKQSVMSAGTLIGDPVRNANGESLGRIKDFVIDTVSGRIEYAVLRVGGFFGLGNKLVAVPWKALDFNADDRFFMFNIDKARLENADGFEPNEWPDMNNEEWANRTHVYFGVSPRWI